MVKRGKQTSAAFRLSFQYSGEIIIIIKSKIDRGMVEEDEKSYSKKFVSNEGKF